jgi:autotransporter-associated beta strand protein
MWFQPHHAHPADAGNNTNRKTKHRMKVILNSVLTALIATAPLHAEFLYESYLVPDFDGQPGTEFSHWDILYAPNGGANFPDASAPNGSAQTASDAGFTPPSDSNPLNPMAFWHASNPTLTQTNGNHFIVGPATTGNIYSFAVPGFYRIDDTTPFSTETIVFQFHSEGTSVDFDSVRLRYDDGAGIQERAPDEWIREYRSGSSGFGGFGNRNAFQWDTRTLGISTYEIVWNSTGSSMSFQEALLDTSDTYEAVVPESRTWNATGNGIWSQPANWQEGSPSNPNGNVIYDNPAPTIATLDGDQTVGEIRFQSADDATINGGFDLTTNTGIATTAEATGTYSIASDISFDALNLMDIQGGTVRLDGSVQGAYGLLKLGSGTLVLAEANTFGTATAGVATQGGTLRVESTNTYGGATAVQWGSLELAGDAPAGAPGALGNATSAVILGVDSATFSSVPEAAQIVIDGDHIVDRNIDVTAGFFEKRIGAKNSISEAEFTGSISLEGTGATATNLKLFARDSTDKARFSGSISGGDTSKSLDINADGEAGTVIYSGSDKTYQNATNIHAGTLVIDSATESSGNGAWSVSSGATLQVDGTLGGSGSLELVDGATLAGSGTISKSLEIGVGVLVSPGNSPGLMSTGSQNWGGGGSYLWEINDTLGLAGSDPGWDWLDISGTLTISATSVDPFEIEITSLTPANIAGEAANFVDSEDYTWTIASASSGIAGFSADAFFLDTSNFQNSFTGDFSIGVSGNDLVLTYTPIPEPSTIAFLVGAGVYLGMGRHRRRAPPKMTHS